MPNGNADLSGKVEAGDQLAGINGTSAIGMKVDDICDAISIAANASPEIELTFLRYIGPLRAMEPEDPVPQADLGFDAGVFPPNELLADDESPRSTMSITNLIEPKSNKKESYPKSSKRGGLKQKFKWLKRGKKTKKAE